MILREFGGCRKLDGSITASSIRILDLCSGTGCISLLLHSLLSPYYDWVSILGIDASSRAVDLARRNLHYNARLDHLSGRAIQEVQFLQGDVLRCKEDGHPDIYEILQEYSHLQAIELGQDENIRWDVLVSNPPYIRPSHFKMGLQRVVSESLSPLLRWSHLIGCILQCLDFMRRICSTRD